MIDYERDGAIARLTLNRPEKLNALNEDAWREIPTALTRAGEDPEVKVVVIAGAGPCFSAGADIASFARLTGDDEVYRFITSINAAMRAFEECSTPIIAAVHGYAYGGGCELTMMSDIVVADETARFALPEIKSGIMPGPGLVRGTSHASLHVLKYLALTGESLTAREACDVGLVNRIVASGSAMDEALRLARIVATHSATALSEAKRYLNGQVPSQFDYVTASLSFLFGTDAARQGASRWGPSASTVDS
jgi:enoyl-CoA hydratase/carnithine racemase